MPGRVPSFQKIAVPPGPGLRRAQAPAASAAERRRVAAVAGPGAGEVGGSPDVLTRFVPVGAASRETRSWLSPLILIAIIGVGGGILAGGVPAGTAGASAVGLLAVAAVLSAIALSERIRDRRVVVPALVGVGLCGAGLDWQASGPDYVISCVALVGLALRTPRRVALLAATPVVAAAAAAEAYDSAHPAATIVAVLSAFGFLFTISAFAAISLEARHQAEVRLAQEAAAGEARERAAALTERSRLARDLHDVLDHSLSVLALQLEVARLTAINEAAGANLVGQIARAHKLTRIGMVNARRALAMLRDDHPPGPAGLPELVSETAAALGIPIALEVVGVPHPLDSDTGLMLYRVVQEALTNVAKHAGQGVRVTVRLVWASGGVEVSVADSGGDGVDASLPSSGFGLTSMAERAALKGGHLSARRAGGGFAVRLWLPARPPAVGRTP
jgi:signal transduction histidine kinase